MASAKNDVKTAAEAKMSLEINEMIRDSKLSGPERQDLYAIAGHMAALSARDGITIQDFTYMYMKGDRDWKADFEKIFGRKAGQAKKPQKVQKAKKEFSTSKIRRAVVKKPKE